jgi:hypothetical protein
MSVPKNTFPMADLHLSSRISSGESYFCSIGNPLHKVPSSGGNIYPHMSNPCHVAFSSQAASSMSMPLQPFMNHYGGGYYPVEQGQGVNQNPSWPAIPQNQSFRGFWSQMPQFTTATCLVIASHTTHTSPTSASHVGDSSPTSASHVGDCLLASASHAGSMSPATASHAGGIHTIEKPKRFRRRARFLCRTCEGIHLTRLCHATVGILEAWFSLEGPSGSKSSMVSPHSIISLVDTTVMPMQSSADTPFSFRG